MNPPLQSAQATLLLIDGNPDSRKQLSAILNLPMHHLVLAHSEQDALRLVAEPRPDLILLDIAAPELDGLAVYTRLRDSGKVSGIPVILLGAVGDTDKIARGLEMGAVDYATMPFHASELTTRVNAQLTLAQLRTRAEEQHRERSLSHRRILECITEGVYGLDPDGVITFANPGACRLTGFSRDDLIGTSVHDAHLYARWDGRPYYPVENGIYVTLRDGQPSHSDNDVFWSAQGDHFPVSWHCSPVLEDGHIQGAVLVFTDISERKRQERALSDTLADVDQLRERLQAENRYLREEVAYEGGFDDIVGDSPALHQVLEALAQVAPTDNPVLIEGEPGTGKEAMARAIHRLSGRHERPMIKVNCGAISRPMIESALFGHEKDAFTGALQRHQGYFELANDGTIFLVEVGELPSEIQAKLVRVLQEHQFSPVGAGFTLRTDVRLIATSSCNLAERVEQGSFRADLFQCLSVCPLQVPPLREHRGDIPLLAEKFLREQARQLNRPQQRLTSQSLRELQDYDWPGNIRELQNLIEHAVILMREAEISVSPRLPGARRKSAKAALKPQAHAAAAACQTLAENEAEHILRVLDHSGWLLAGKGGAAEILGLPASTLRSRMKKLGISRPG